MKKHAPKLLNIPESVRIIHEEDLDNQIIVDIPKTRLTLHGLRSKDNHWDVSILNRDKCSKRVLEKDMPEKVFAYLICKTLSHTEQDNFKNKKNLKQILEHYKSLTIKALEQED